MTSPEWPAELAGSGHPGKQQVSTLRPGSLSGGQSVPVGGDPMDTFLLTVPFASPCFCLVQVPLACRKQTDFEFVKCQAGARMDGVECMETNCLIVVLFPKTGQGRARG